MHFHIMENITQNILYNDSFCFPQKNEQQIGGEITRELLLQLFEIQTQTETIMQYEVTTLTQKRLHDSSTPF